MFMPAEYAWTEPIVIAAIVVFIISWIGNSIYFGNRFVNALLTAVVFALIFGALAYFKLGTVTMTLPGLPTAPVARTAPPAQPAPPAPPPANPVTTVPAK
jgi:hypothetical protein